MQLVTDFNINAILYRAHQRCHHKRIIGYEIMEIVTQSCYAGTQTFYDCRVLSAEKVYDGFSEKGKYKWAVGHVDGEGRNMGMRRLREDEVILVSSEHRAILTGEVEGGEDPKEKE